MERYNQFNRLVVEDFKADTWEHPLHNHNHFEIIFIRAGTGIHHLNKRLMPYREGHLYLLGPEDEHEFIIDEKTHFVYFKFTRLYFDAFDVDSPAQWNRDMDQLLSKKWGSKRNLLQKHDDIKIVDNLLSLIVNEYAKNDAFSKQLIFRFFTSILLVLKRNKGGNTTRNSRSTHADITEALLEYIEVNIYTPKLVSQKEIAVHFHYSSNYIGVLFKEKVGITLKKYIQEYRYNLLKQRLKHSDLRLKQLALEFGFTDESHLHKFVKQQAGINMPQLREQLHG